MFLREINSVADIIFVIKESYPDAREIFKLHFIIKKMEEEDSRSTLDEN